MQKLDDSLYKQIFTILPFGMLLVDCDGVIFEWSNHLVSLTKIERKKALGKRLDMLFPGIKTKRFEFAVEQVVSYKHPQVLSQILNNYLIPIPLAQEFSIDGMDYMQQSVSIYPVSYHKKNYALVVIIDATETSYQRHMLLRVAKRFEEESVHDELTGLYNRRFLWEYLESELPKASREKYEVVCSLYDLDYFKEVNDTLGHTAGDEILVSFANVINTSLRAGDKVFRYGGEEFITISSNKKGAQADSLAKRICLNMAKKKKHGSIERVVTCSAGVSVATMLEKALGSDTLVEHADKALYEAKEAGRNRVCIYGDHQASSSRGGRAKSD
jgi:diguanylate cyclase (GGDEF)-like protein